MISITNAAKEPHITPLQDSMWHRGMAGIDSCVFNFFENFAAEVSSNNSVKIRSGIGMIQGRYFCVEPSTYDEVTIANGTQGERRKDLIVCRWTVDEEQKVQSGDWVVIQGTPTTGTPDAPPYTTGDLDAGDLIADMPFYEVTLDGINVTGVVQKFTSLSGIGKFPNPLPISKGGTGKTTATEALKALGGASIKKVWTNASIGSAFGAQTLQISTTADYILILTNRGETIVVLKNAGRITHYGCEAYPNQRGFTYTDNSLAVTIGEELNSGWQTNNNVLKPWYIFEIKGVI